MALDIVIMAAGKGTRMKSARPKVLHRLAGRSLLQHVLAAAAGLEAQRIVAVTGHGADQVETAVSAPNLVFARQQPQLGTGHAVQMAAPLLHDEGTTLILNGDVPLIETDTMRSLVQACAGRALALLTVVLPDPSGYGRVIRSGDPVGGTIEGIVEHKDATAPQRRIQEVYTGVMAVPTAHLKRWLAALTNDNAQGEYYLTDVVAMAVADHVPVVATHAHDETEVRGVNSPADLADPARIDIRGELLCGQDVEIDVGCVFEGRVEIGDGACIESHCVIRNARIDADAVIHSFTHMDGEALGVRIGQGALVGPFARLRPGADLGPEVHIGNFVEVKNSTLARGAKANHLAYLGDATVGERVNYGAGSITANYDGAFKHRTVIGPDVHVGSNCVLVAPITLGAGATIGAGSTVSKDAPAGQLTVARAKAVSLTGWVRPVKVRK